MRSLTRMSWPDLLPELKTLIRRVLPISTRKLLGLTCQAEYVHVNPQTSLRFWLAVNDEPANTRLVEMVGKTLEPHERCAMLCEGYGLRAAGPDRTAFLQALFDTAPTDQPLQFCRMHSKDLVVLRPPHRTYLTCSNWRCNSVHCHDPLRKCTGANACVTCAPLEIFTCSHCTATRCVCTDAHLPNYWTNCHLCGKWRCPTCGPCHPRR